MALIFLILALVLALVSAWPVPSKVNLLSLAFAAYIASLLVGHVG